MAVILRHFDRIETAQEAVEALRLHGIADEQLGILSRAGARGHFHAPEEINPNDMSAAEGATLGTLAGLVAGVAALATPLGPLIAVGPLFGALVGALAGAATGGAVAALVDSGVDRDTARRLAATLEDEAAVLVSVEVADEQVDEVRALLAQSEALHADEVRFFQDYHARHADANFADFQHAYHFGYRAAALNPRPFAAAEADLQRDYIGDFDGDREAIQVGYQRYLDTVQTVSAAQT